MSSQFTSKLGTNYCPKDEEIAEIRALLVGPTIQLKGLDDEIAELQKALDKLAAERNRLSAYVDAHRALISPVRRLPLDIIQEIFIACIPTHRNCVMSALEAPVLLGRICSSWRGISLSTPRLWSRLHIVEPSWSHGSALGPLEKKLAQRAETTKIWLGRSGQCPLSISLQSPFHPPGRTSATENLVTQTLLPFASRWQHITIATVPSALQHLTEADVPILKSISIREIHDSTDIPARWESLDFLHGPEISSFSIVGASFAPLELRLRWDHLTELSMFSLWRPEGGHLTSVISLQLFSRCPQLRACRLIVHDTDPDEHSGVREPNIELSLLHTLDVQFFGYFSTTIRQLFTGRVRFPQLRHLRLRGIPHDTDTIPYADLLATASHIEILDINIELFLDAKTAFADFFRGLPATILEIKISSLGGLDEGSRIFDDEILELLIISPSCPTPSCPGLEVLEVSCCCSFSDEAILRFVKSRRLKRLAIRIDGDIERDIRPELEPLVQNGLHLELIYTPSSTFDFSPWAGLADAPR
ncbi:hypothetical protein DFH09DRAFT_1151983 [Mycena vulgaris]|nr:hypothetical protein DFH09DRAFT_1151983 [Mycena vulgaris]